MWIRSHPSIEKWEVCCSKSQNSCSALRKKRSKSMMGKNTGPLSEETKEKIRETQTGKLHSEETKRKISNSNKGRPGWNKGIKTGPRSEETKKKLRDLNTGKIQSEETKKKMSTSLKGRIPWNKGMAGLFKPQRKENKLKKLCDYGCGLEAIYQFKNGNWCCNISVSKCPTSRQNLRELNLGKIQSEETKRKNSESSKGISAWNKGMSQSDEFKRKQRESHIGKVHSEETKKKISESHKGKKKKKFSLKNYQEKYPFFCMIEELRETENGDIQGHCKNHNCKNSKEKGGWFTLTSGQITHRRDNLEHEDGNGGHYFYCCQECKDSCPLYRLNSDPLKETTLPYTHSEYATFREFVLERNNHICQYCGKQASIVHHKRPQKLEPFFALDPDLAISVCRDCHYKKGHPSGTPHSTGNLAKIICSVESQEFLNQI